MPYRKNKDADQPAIRAVWSAPLLFAAEVVYYLYFLYPKFRAFCWADRFESYLVGKPRWRFSRDVAINLILALNPHLRFITMIITRDWDCMCFLWWYTDWVTASLCKPNNYVYLEKKKKQQQTNKQKTTTQEKNNNNNKKRQKKKKTKKKKKQKKKKQKKTKQTNKQNKKACLDHMVFFFLLTVLRRRFWCCSIFVWLLWS